MLLLFTVTCNCHTKSSSTLRFKFGSPNIVHLTFIQKPMAACCTQTTQDRLNVCGDFNIHVQYKISNNFTIVNEYNIFRLIKINDHSVNSGDTPMIRAGPMLPEYSNTRLCEHHHRNAIAFQPPVTPNWCCMLITG